MSKNSTNERSLAFVMFLYEENEHFSECLTTIKNCQYAMIKHDSDLWTDDKVNGTHKEYCKERNIKVGDPVKTHYHIVIKNDNARWLSSIQKSFIYIPKNDIQVCHNFRGAIRYLIHADDPNKYQYSFSSIDTNMLDIVGKQFLDKVDSDSVATGIINFINDNLGYCDESDVIKYLQSIGHPSYYPRYRNMVVDLLKIKAKQLDYSKEYKNLLNVIRVGFENLNDKLTSPKDKKELYDLQQTMLNFVNDSYKYRDK